MSDATGKKLSRNIVLMLGLFMIGGMVGVFVMQYAMQPQAVNPGRQKQLAATEAAQIGNDVPESEKAARAEIVQADQAVREKLAHEAEARRERAKTYPQTPLPFETGTVTPKQVELYRQAKDALKQAMQKFAAGRQNSPALPQSFDESGGTGQPAAPKPQVRGARPLQSQATQSPPAAAAASQPVAETNSATNGGTAQPAGSLASLAAGGPGSGSRMIRSLLSKQAAVTKEDPNESWLQKQQKTAKPQAPLRAGPVPADLLLQEGAVIPLVLLTALNNTLPGHVSARVTQNVYDSLTGDTLLIPAGTRMEGRYDQSTLFGQNRMMLAFNRMILPDGASVWLGAWSAGDAAGRSGAPGELDNHLLEQFGTGILLATIGWALEPSNSSSIVLNTTGTANGSIGTAAGQITADTAGNILSNYQNLKPELNVKAGSKLAVIVLQDIVFPDQNDRKENN